MLNDFGLVGQAYIETHEANADAWTIGMDKGSRRVQRPAARVTQHHDCPLTGGLTLSADWPFLRLTNEVPAVGAGDLLLLGTDAGLVACAPATGTL